MNRISLPISKRLKLKLGGKKYYLTQLLPITIYNRYGIEKGYSIQQIKATVEALGYQKYYDEETARALLGNTQQFGDKLKYYRIREKYGLVKEGPEEVLWVYCKIEKFDPDPLGVDRATETTGGMDGSH